MFSVLLAAALAIGADSSLATSPGHSVEQQSVENQTNAGFVIIDDGAAPNRVVCNCTDRCHNMRSGLSCDCIRSSANYSWNWLVSAKIISKALQIRQCGSQTWRTGSCPAYYGLYDRPYDCRRAFDYQWRSPPYRPRNVAPRGANSTRGCIGMTKPGDGDEELVPTPEVLVDPKTP